MGVPGTLVLRPPARGVATLAATSAAMLAAMLLSSQARALDWQTPWAEPNDRALTAENSDEYAWRLFTALNWPADLRTGVADRSASLGVDGPVVWESWSTAGAIFLDDGSDPGPWAERRDSAAIATESRFETRSLKELPNARHIVGGVMVPLADPLANASRLTEIRMNRASYDYIRRADLYNLGGQLRAYAAGTRIDFPLGARNVKAKWRPISDAERSRYHTVQVAFTDGTKHLFGLTALHIASKDQAHWFWATFEHVDNPLLADSEGWQLPSRDRFSCRGPAADCNRAPRGIGLEGTVWQYYRLRGTLTSYVDSVGRPQRLANSELETGMQTTASCMTCHARASIGVVAGAPARLPIFDLSRSELAQRALTRRGYVGLPKPEWFGDSHGAGLGPAFRPVDFVWSMAKAKPAKSAVATTPPPGSAAIVGGMAESIGVVSKQVGAGG